MLRRLFLVATMLFILGLGSFVSANATDPEKIGWPRHEADSRWCRGIVCAQ